jgi:arylsulfatase A-like enzyme
LERRDFLKSASLGTMGTLMGSPAPSQATQAASADKPNIIFIVSDQHRAGLTKRSGYPLDTSPALDALATHGVGFERAYITSPLCVPSRTSMLTGRWPEAHHVRINQNPQDAFFDKHLYQVAKESGYKTGLAGKNHTFLKSTDLDFWREYGLDTSWMPPNPPREYLEFESWMKALHANVALEPTPFPLDAQYPYRIISDAIEFIGDAGKQPFILQVGFSEPHDPEQVPKPYWDMYPPESVPDRCAGPEALNQLGFRAQWAFQHANQSFGTEKVWRRYKSNYLGMLRFLDDQLARLMAYLKQSDLLKNTIVVYLADHGDYLMDYGLPRKGVGLFECLTRIPMVWAGYGIRPSTVGSSAFVSMADVFPTLCEAMSAPIPHGVQGRSLWPLLTGQDYPREEFRSIYSEVGCGGLFYDADDKIPPGLANHGATWDELNKVSMSGLQKMVRMGDWKLVYDMMGYGQMYHLPSDPCELKNLFGHPATQDKQSELLAELLMWTIRSQDSLPTGPQNDKYQTKWPREHNWYSPYRHGIAPEPFIA